MNKKKRKKETANDSQAKNLSTLESNKLRKYFLSRETEIKWNSTVTAIKKGRKEK